MSEESRCECSGEPTRSSLIRTLLGWLLCFPSRLLQLHRLRRPAPVRWIAGILAWVLNVCWWFMLFVCLGGLGPLIRFVGVPVARMVGVPVSLEGCSVWPLAGSVRLEGLRVSNPETFVECDASRYGQTPLLDLDELDVGVNLLALKDEVIHIRRLNVRGTALFYAHDGKLGTDNVSALLEQILPPSLDTPPEAPVISDPPPAVSAAGGVELPQVSPLGERLEDSAEAARDLVTKLGELPRFRIDTLDISGNAVRAYVDFGVPGFAPEFTFAPPPLRRTAYDNAALIADVRAFVDGFSSGGKALLDGAKADVKAAGEDISRSVREALDSGDFDKAKEDLKESVEDLKKSSKDLRESLRGLF